MLRKLTAAVAALFCIAGFGLATGAPAQAKSVLPVQGSYVGKDHADRKVTFELHGNQMTRFTVGGHVIGGAHVSHGAWHETCHNGYCTKGHWQLDFHVVGYWRAAGGHWTAFSASAPQPPQQGDFMGRDHSGNSVHASFNGTRVHGFRVEGKGHFPEAHVSHGSWSEVCGSGHAGLCFKGHFQEPHTVVGSWRVKGGAWHAWEAYGYSF